MLFIHMMHLNECLLTELYYGRFQGINYNKVFSYCYSQDEHPDIVCNIFMCKRAMWLMNEMFCLAARVCQGNLI